jgi:S1-C subfamily serine protease
MTSRRAHATAGAAVAADDEHLLQSVVKVFTVHSSPNYFQPWQNKPQRETSGSGVVVTAPVPGGVGILTNAHVVADQTFVQVRRHGSSVKHRARVHAVGHACDLAVLAVDDRSFWAEGADTPHPPTPLSLGDVPHLQDQVTVVGFPQGGDNLSITSGVVSRIELTNYAHGAAQLLAIQLDAAINPGNSGGPALGSDGSVVGLAFQNLANADNIGYVIPTPIIRRFLEDVEDDWKTAATHMPRPRTRPGQTSVPVEEKAEEKAIHHAGFCSLGIKCQPTDNPAMREYLGMGGDETGVLLTEVLELGPAAGRLQKDDVLKEVDGNKVANDGTVSFRGWERVAFDYIISLKRPGETVEMKIRRRNGKKAGETEAGDESDEDGTSPSLHHSEAISVSFPVNPRAPLVPVHQYDRLPSYYVYAGLVFSPLTQPHLQEFGDDWFNAAPRKLVDRALNDHPTRAGQEVVILSQVLADEVNAGYQGMHDLEVRAVNGKVVSSLRELKAEIEKAPEFLRLDFVNDRVLVISREEAERAHGRIMAKHRVPSRMSQDLVE